MTLLDEPDTDVSEAPDGGSRLRIVLVAVLAVAALVLAGGAGWLLGHSSGSADTPSSSSVDAGFARDMATHHEQAVIMAGYERDNTTDPALKVLATDMETSQQFQIGQMNGWLDAWHLPYTTTQPRMAWMGSSMGDMHGMDMHGNLMPGMATPDQMDKLESLHGKALDILFLQLMIRHHQGGLPMAEYAVAHASEGYVKTLAQAMLNAQQSEITYMEQQLRKLGGTPLPAP
ncbi:MAG: DUF305 domain-containing protein [Jatrophihabitans sp.]|uniref:DUF305 domain-containing protein n=1 Tax=Jatrophihabitans sp. TaxID=1932789 RepID=UPI003F80DCA9